LAREASRYHVNKSAPWFAVEGSNVVPDGEGVEASVVLSGREHPLGGRLELDGTDAFPPEQFAAENAASSACEKCQLM
jgi:hypothetical protein